MQDKRDRVIAAARACLGTPWRHQGRNPETGLDCVGLVRHAGIEAGLLPPMAEYLAYCRAPRPVTMRRVLRQYFVALPYTQDPEPGDILWLTFNQIPMHVAIYTGPTIIHAVVSAPSRVVEHAYRAPWPSRRRGVFRFKELARE